MGMTEIVCSECGSAFLRKKSEHAKSLRKGATKFYCSQSCVYSSRAVREIRDCLNCGKSVEKRPSDFSANTFCSRSCAASFNNTGVNRHVSNCNRKVKTKRVRRTVAERVIEWSKGDNSALPPSAERKGTLTQGFRLEFAILRGGKCERCGFPSSEDFLRWNRLQGMDNEAIISLLDVAHRDNDHTNMSYDNLELLCKTCHVIDTRLNPVERGEGRWVNYRS